MTHFAHLQRPLRTGELPVLANHTRARYGVTGSPLHHVSWVTDRHFLTYCSHAAWQKLFVPTCVSLGPEHHTYLFLSLKPGCLSYSVHIRSTSYNKPVNPNICEAMTVTITIHFEDKKPEAGELAPLIKSLPCKLESLSSNSQDAGPVTWMSITSVLGGQMQGDVRDCLASVLNPGKV